MEDLPVFPICPGSPHFSFWFFFKFFYELLRRYQLKCTLRFLVLPLRFFSFFFFFFFFLRGVCRGSGREV